MQEYRDRRSIQPSCESRRYPGWLLRTVIIGSARPNQYVPRVREKLGIDDEAWGLGVCAEHALPLGWESMEYEQFLKERRVRMADVIRAAYRKLGGEENIPAVNTAVVHARCRGRVESHCGHVERGLRSLARSEYTRLYRRGCSESKLRLLSPSVSARRFNERFGQGRLGADPLSVCGLSLSRSDFRNCSTSAKYGMACCTEILAEQDAKRASTDVDSGHQRRYAMRLRSMRVSLTYSLTESERRLRRAVGGATALSGRHLHGLSRQGCLRCARGCCRP